MLAIIVDIEARPGQGDALRAALLTQGENSKKHEEGCRYFDLCVNPENSEQFMLYELYNDEAAIEAHRATDYYIAFREATEPLVKSRDLRLWTRL